MGQFVVIGLGNFGHNVAISLFEQRNQVLAIDANSKKIEQIKDKVTQAVVVNVKEKEALSEFISNDIDAAIVSLGDKIEASILTTLYLKELGVKKIIVKAINDDHGQILKLIGAMEIIYPEKEEAVRLARRLTVPNLIEHIPLASEYSIVEIAVPDNFVGKSLKELRLRSKYNVEVIAVKDVLQDTLHLIPEADVKIKPDSVLMVIGKEVDINKFKV
ncbi:MAG: TrkA family potassium uptake protein [Candidatus Omnitrophica bacterium]|nr:TrkA family potassium uptake protein [Candidatus Omnitrophota bacterium]MBU1047484.1 TrkA family potassium uptake protein [Candidatus Omnitrophota bacterium]MBU1766499.1 TrkA family potassium uptake protein [Candidatus Omnitrophota bacterium]MBU1888847.1 TrkA family potassium uptake protein [Candidatus Omnitrophota bacterium]